MALGVSATMAILLFSLAIISHCGALQADSATKASSSAYSTVVVRAKLHAVQDAEGLLRLPSSVAEPDPDRSLVEPVAEPDPDRSAVKAVAEPDPDRSAVEAVAEPDPDRSPVEPVAEPDPDQSHPDSDEKLATKKPCHENQQGNEKVKEQIDDEDKVEKEEKEKAKKTKEGKKKTKKHHDGDVKGKEKAKKHHRQSDEKVKEEEHTKNRIHRHHQAEDESVKKKNKLSHHIKSNDNSDDEEEEKKEKLWRKAIKSKVYFIGDRISDKPDNPVYC